MHVRELCGKALDLIFVAEDKDQCGTTVSVKKVVKRRVS